MGNLDQFETIANAVLAQAKEANVEAEAYITIGKQTQISVSKGEVEKLSFAGSKGLGVRILNEGQMGYAYTSDFSEESVAQTTAEAITLSQISDGDAHRTFPPAQTIPDEDLHIYKAGVEAMPMEEKVQLAKAVEAAAHAADDRVAVVLRTSYLDSVGTVYLANSNGFNGSYKASFAAAFTQAMAMADGDRAMAFGLGTGRSPQELDAHKIGTEAGERAAKLLGGKPVPTQEATVVYSPFAAASVVGAMSRALSAQNMQRNRSFLHGKIGQDVASDMVTILDNGRLPGGMSTRPFDAEGNPTQATRLIDEGVLQGVLYDQYTANREGTNSTGNASRGSHRSAPSLAPSNFYLQPGNQTPEEIIAEVESGLYVVNVMNTASINPVSGDYSVSAQGFWIDQGKLGAPVNNITIALPLDKLLHNVSAVANDLLFLPFFGALGTPSFRVEGIMIGGS